MDAFDHFLELSQLPTSFMAKLALSNSSCQQNVQVESISKHSIIPAKYYLFKYSATGLVVWIFTSIWLGCNQI
jgi:hypothetical protein